MICRLFGHKYKFRWDTHGDIASIPDEKWTCQRKGCDAELRRGGDEIRGGMV